MKNSKGFTLVELIVSITILSIVLVAIFGFMLAGTKSYETVNTRVDLRVDSQIATNFISESLVDCNYGICFDNDVLYIINKSDADTDSFTADIFDYHNNSITYTSETFTTASNLTYTKKTESDPADLLVDHLSDIDVIFYSSPTPMLGDKINKVVFTLILSNRDKDLTVTKTVALRNSPILVELTTT